MFTRDYEIAEMLRYGRQKHAIGRLDHAEGIYAQILRDRPAEREARLWMARLQIQKENLPAAREHLETALELFGTDAEAHYLLALLCHTQGDVDGALFQIHMALGQRPDFLECHQLLAQIQLNGPNYREFLRDCHEELAPRVYLEIGVEAGGSLKLAEQAEMVIAVDPFPRAADGVPSQVALFTMESDAFFADKAAAQLQSRRLEMAFVDGLHEARQALRDVLNCERFSAPESLILMHDVVPLNEYTASVERNSFFWSGDVWKVVVALKEFFPDLRVQTVDCPPTGVAVIQRLNPSRRVNDATLQRIYAFMDGLRYDDIGRRKKEALNLVEYDRSSLRRLLGR